MLSQPVGQQGAIRFVVQEQQYAVHLSYSSRMLWITPINSLTTNGFTITPFAPWERLACWMAALCRGDTTRKGILVARNCSQRAQISVSNPVISTRAPASGGGFARARSISS